MDIIFKNNSTGKVIINGTEYQGNSVSMDENVLIIDGQVVKYSGEFSPIINVQVQGDCTSVRSISGDITVEGNAGNVSTTSGDITVNNSLNGNANTVSGDITVRGIATGNANTVSGTVRR